MVQMEEETHCKLYSFVNKGPLKLHMQSWQGDDTH